MSFTDVYFNTEVFSFFVFNFESQEDLDFHPIEGHYEANISFIVVEEFIHKMKGENWDKWDSSYDSFDDVWLRFEKTKSLFKNGGVNTGELMNQYSRVVTQLSRNSKGDFEHSSLNSMDILHLCMAELKGCRVIYTLDGGFLTEDIDKIAHLFDDLKRIIHLEYDGSELQESGEEKKIAG